MPKKKTNNGESKPKENVLDLESIRQALDMAENQILAAKRLLFTTFYEEKASNLKIDGRIVEGVFDGENMKGADGKKYPVPSNYASKSKLVPGDILKLTIGEDGSFLYKQIGPIDRRRIMGRLYRDGERYFVIAEGKNYQVLPASVTYFKAEEGNKVSLIVPKDEQSDWGAVDHLAI